MIKEIVGQRPTMAKINDRKDQQWQSTSNIKLLFPRVLIYDEFYFCFVHITICKTKNYYR